jgi:hypothetical protein
MLRSQLKPVSDFAALLGGTALEECFAFWRSVRSDGQVPLKARIDPVMMPRHILPNLFLYERMPDGRFRCRLSGTALCEVFQFDATGLYLDEFLAPSVIEDRLSLYRDVLARALPVAFVTNIAGSEERSWIKFCRLMLPISMSGERADAIFGMVVFPEFDRHKLARRPLQVDSFETVAWATPEDLTGG